MCSREDAVFIVFDGKLIPVHERANPYHDKAGKFAPKSGKATGTGATAKVTIGGKQYGVGDSIMVNGKQHHIAEITNDKVTVRPGAAPKTSSPVKKTTPKTVTTVDSGKPSVTGASEINSPVEAKAYISRQNLPQPTSHSKEAFVLYSERHYSSINGALRSDRDPGQIEFDMQKHMKKSKLKEPVKVTRAIDFGSSGVIPSDLVGKTIQDKAYLSTSLLNGGPKTGKKFWDAKDTIMEIDVPAGTNAVYMEGLTKNKGEHELLINKGSKLKIKEAKKVGGKWRVKAEIVP